jgi:hypothetical protein
MATVRVYSLGKGAATNFAPGHKLSSPVAQKSGFYETNPVALPGVVCHNLSRTVSFCPFTGIFTPYFYYKGFASRAYNFGDFLG